MKRIYVITFIMAAVICTGVVLVIIDSPGPFDQEEQATMEIVPTEPAVLRTGSSVNVTVGIQATGYYFHVTNVEISAFDNECQLLGSYDFGQINSSERMNPDIRRTISFSEVPRQLQIDVPENYTDTSGDRILVHGLHRVTDIDSQDQTWTEFSAIVDDPAFEICGVD